jgi:hypothetical protein
MRCKACDAEMVLLNVVQDTMAVPGLKYDTFMCSECHDIVRCLSRDAEPIPSHTAPSVAPASTVQDEPVPAPGRFRRILAKLRSR